jgi:FkbM family methyltransferase
MFRLLKNSVKGLLEKRGYRLTWQNPKMVSGDDLFRDLALLIDTSSPVVFDVGANVGQTIRAVQRAWPTPRIIAFEPTPALAQQLRKDFGSQVQIMPVALGAEPSMLELHTYETSVLNSLLPLETKADSVFSHAKDTGIVRVELDTVDRVCHTLGIAQLDLLKIDTQGYDLNVLHGAKAKLSSGSVRFVLVEMNFVRLYESQCFASDIQNFMAEQRFKMIDLYEKFRVGPALGWCTALFAHENETSSD